MDYGILSMIPIIICFMLIIISKNAFISIISGIVVAVILVLVKEGNFILFSSIIGAFSSVSTSQTVVFILIVGAIIKATELSGGVKGLIIYLEEKKVNIASPVLTQLFAMLIGMLLFVDATSSMAITSVVGKPLFKKAKISTEKLALITNSTAAPIAWLIPFGGAGAFTTGLVSQIDGIEGNPFSVVLRAVPFQIYTISLLAILVISIVFRFEIGPIRKMVFKDSKEDIVKEIGNGKARNMIFPIVTLLVGIAVILFITGNGNILLGNGTAAVFYSGIATLVITLIFYRIQNVCTISECLKWYFDGVKSMFIVTLLLAVALVFSNILGRVGTASYLVGLFGVVSNDLLPFIAFLIATIIAFSTGTSGGTVAIVTGLLLPVAVLTDANVSLVLGAIISGSVFGDQNSVISDSVILTSSVTGIDPVTHVKTQFPYTLAALGVTGVVFFILGFIL